MKDRLIKFLEHLKVGQNKFAQNVGLSPSFINNLGEGINLKSLQKILKVYPQLNERWLLTGEGDMIRELTQIAKGNGSINSNISGNVEGNVIISHNDFSNMLEVQKGNLEIQKELNDRLKTSQEQVNILLEILQKKEL